MTDTTLDSSRVSRAEAVARAIETEISTGQVAAGEILGTKDDLKHRFGVAVATINEAIKLLGARGYVEARPGPGGGVFVRPVTLRRAGPIVMDFEWSEATMADYHEVRDALEPVIVRHAAQYHDENDIAKLTEIIERMRENLDHPLEYLRDNTRFHLYLASITPNKPLRSVYTTVIDFFSEAVDTDALPSRLSKRNADVHDQLLEAIKSRDGRRLAAAMRAHDRHRRDYGIGQIAGRSHEKHPA